MIAFCIFFPMLGAFLCTFAGKARNLRNLVSGLVTGTEFLLSLVLFAAADTGASLTLPGICESGLSFEITGFSKVYFVILSFMWLMTALFGFEYFSHYQNTDRYFFFHLFTEGALAGVFFSADLFTALVFFEIMSFTSYTWVVQEETDAALRAGDTYLAIAVIGGLAALCGLFLLNWKLGTTRISDLYECASALQEKKVLYTAGALILTGFGAKAGMFPLHIWLPKAHPVAPAPASALLSGILTKSGIFGILAISANLFRKDPAWGACILLLGTITMFLGAFLALFSIDLKRTLACSSVSQIGFILVGTGLLCLLSEENSLACRGTLLHMMNHSLLKLLLFLSAGAVHMNTHALDLNKIRGFGRKKPLLKACFLSGALGISGVPFWNGYLSKTMLHEAIVEYTAVLAENGSSVFLMKAAEWIFLISGGLTAAYMTKLFAAVFFERNNDPEVQKAFDEKKNYMNPLSASVLAVCAAVLPVLGIFSHALTDRIAAVGIDFLVPLGPSHRVAYLSFENLKGGLTSLLIGAAVYFLIVRRVLMKKENGNTVYVNLWPEKLDLEDRVYRPLLLQILPGIFGSAAAIFANNVLTGKLWKRLIRTWEILAHAAGDSMDALVLLLRKCIFRENEDTLSDRLVRRISSDGHYDELRTAIDATRVIMTSLSFALLLLCLTLCAAFLFLR